MKYWLEFLKFLSFNNLTEKNLHDFEKEEMLKKINDLKEEIKSLVLKIKEEYKEIALIKDKSIEAIIFKGDECDKVFKRQVGDSQIEYTQKNNNHPNVKVVSLKDKSNLEKERNVNIEKLKKKNYGFEANTEALFSEVINNTVAEALTNTSVLLDHSLEDLKSKEITTSDTFVQTVLEAPKDDYIRNTVHSNYTNHSVSEDIPYYSSSHSDHSSSSSYDTSSSYDSSSCDSGGCD